MIGVKYYRNNIGISDNGFTHEKQEGRQSKYLSKT
jgi:hypothetical protein